MEISPLLAVGVVLLVVVGGLALWQRVTQAAHPDRSRAASTPTVPSPSLVAGADGLPGGSASRPRRVDEVFGPITFDGQELWEREEDLEFAGTTVVLELTAGPDGPGDTHRAIVRTAVAEGRALEARARAIVEAELRRRGIALDDLEVYELAAGLDDEDRVAGYLWYSADFSGEIGVSSIDLWRTLELEVVE